MNKSAINGLHTFLWLSENVATLPKLLLPAFTTTTPTKTFISKTGIKL